MQTSPLVSRIISIVIILASLGVALWLGLKFLEPVPVPPPPAPRQAVTFDRNADVSANPVFTGLQPYGPSQVESGPVGRVNPFIPAPSSTSP